LSCHVFDANLETPCQERSCGNADISCPCTFLSHNVTGLLRLRNKENLSRGKPLSHRFRNPFAQRCPPVLARSSISLRAQSSPTLSPQSGVIMDLPNHNRHIIGSKRVFHRSSSKTCGGTALPGRLDDFMVTQIPCRYFKRLRTKSTSIAPIRAFARMVGTSSRRPTAVA